jgi:hypothetical protein
MNNSEKMETTPQNKKADTNSTADRAAGAKKTREDAARKLKAAAKAANTGAGSGSGIRSSALTPPTTTPTPPPNRGVSY